MRSGLLADTPIAHNGHMGEFLSVVVCTRNRPLPLAKVVQLLLQGAPDELELIVVDQSDGGDTEAALASVRMDSRLRYVHSTKRGKGASLNEGLALARGAIVVCTDDDCLPPSGWVAAMTRTLQSQPNAVIAFCRVTAIPHDPTTGYVPTYEITKNRRLRSVSDLRNGLGIGAGMAVRRDFMRMLGGFDESFGPGGRFPSADEWDIAIRALLSGREVYETADVEIVHDGFRTFAEGAAHARRDWFALGAVCAKPLRAGYWKAAIVPIWLFSSRAVWPSLADVLLVRRPRGIGRVVAFIQGFARGLAARVDRTTLRFVDRRLRQRQ